MADRSHLIRTPITDRSGKQTTVYRRPEAGPGSAASLPAPTLALTQPAPPAPAEGYAERLAAMREQNERWRAGDRVGVEAAQYEALLGMQHMAWLLAESSDKPSSERLAQRLSEAVSLNEHSCIGIAGNYARHYCAIVNDFSIDFSDEDRLEQSPYWETYTADHAAEVMTVAHTLLYLDLITFTDVPNGPNERLMAHLFAHATGSIDYSGPGKEIGDAVRLIDERPDDVISITTGHQQGLHAAAIRAQLDGSTPPPLTSGAL